MQLQLAIDALELDKALFLAEKTKKYIDIIEIGTPLIKCRGLEMVRWMKMKFENLPIFVDLKTMDAGEYEVSPFFEAGAHYVTVLGAADQKTIEGAVKAARRYGGHVVVDLIAVEDKASRIKALLNTGADYFNVHTGIDQQAQGASPLSEMKAIRAQLPEVKLFVAGGITDQTVGEILPFAPSVVIVGGGITGAADPEQAARTLKTRLQASR